MFGHLQVYSSYSFHQSTILIKDLINKAKENNITTLALTDKNNMHGAMEFFQACKKSGIKPIFGVEASVNIDGEIYPFILLAKDDQGYKEIVKIVCDIQLKTEESVLLEDIKSEHIYVLTPGMEGIIERLILKEMIPQATSYLEKFKTLFKDNFYVMIQDLNIEYQKYLNQQLIALSSSHQIKVVWGNQVSYLDKNQAPILSMLEAANKQIVLDKHFTTLTNQCYLKTEEEIKNLYDIEIQNNTKELLQSCNATIQTDQQYMPVFDVPEGFTPEIFLRELCKLGLKKRFHDNQVPRHYVERLKYELSIIIKMEYSSYFLIVWDIIRFARKKGILVGPGRGSAAGSLVSYVLGITNVDPIEYRLFFERFLNPERISMPDIDIDFQDNRRDEVIEYVFHKYGANHAAQICTFTTFGPKVAIKDLGKALGMPLARLETFTKMLPNAYQDKRSLKEICESSNRLMSMLDRDQTLKTAVESAYIVESLPRNISTHAAGVVLSKEPLDHIVPLSKGPSNTVLTQFSKDYLEEIGLLKIDFLGLKNLTIIAKIVDQLKQRGISFDIRHIPLDDKKTLEMIRKGDTFGVFQLESEGMKHTLRKIQAQNLEEVIAAIALFRPGPMENIPLYAKYKLSNQTIEYIDPVLKDILEPTYGVIVYQEQIMQIAQTFASFSLGRADILRKAISKKQGNLFQQLEKEFIDGALNNGHSLEKAKEVYALIDKFANYGFNRSHSVAYGLLAYQMAYLKSNYPTEFYAALLSNDQSSESNKYRCMQECMKYNVKILPPSVNHSYDYFSVENNHIRFSLVGIKNVGSSAYKEIIKERELNGNYLDIFDFFSRIVDKRFSIKSIEALIHAGAFDEFGINRSTLKANIEKIVNYVKVKNKYGIDEKPILIKEKDNQNEILELEKEALGVYISTHPILLMKEKHPLKNKIVDLYRYHEIRNGNVLSIITIQRIKIIQDKKGQSMCFITMMDNTGFIEATVFSNTYQRYRNIIQKGATLLVEAKVSRNSTLSVIINQLEIVS